MLAGSRSLPDRPSLRYLRLEAKRRLAAAEFATLHNAQAAIAREHGQPSWAALKQLIAGQDDSNQETHSHALDQLRWVIARFAGASRPGWTAPGQDELQAHFDERFLTVLPPAALVPAISRVAADMNAGELTVLAQSPAQAHVQLEGVQYIAATEPEPPHRLIALRAIPVGSRVKDTRTANPPVRTHGNVPAEVREIAAQASAELGLAALVIAGHAKREPWILAQGWADLDRKDPLGPGHRFGAPGVTALVTTTAVLRLVADHEIALDDPVNRHLTAVRLADDTITVRELLTHTAGVDSPTEMYTDTRPELPDVMGPVIACSGPRGTVHPSNGGMAVLGQLLADVTAMPYPDAAAKLVLRPLHMTDSTFRTEAGPHDPRDITGYNLTLEGIFQPIPARIPALTAVAGLWSTGADLVRLGLGWASLLPGALAHEALSPQTGPGPGGTRVGLGWLLVKEGHTAAHAGADLEGTASLTVRLGDGQVSVVLTSRLVPLTALVLRLQDQDNQDNQENGESS